MGKGKGEADMTTFHYMHNLNFKFEDYIHMPVQSYEMVS